MSATEESLHAREQSVVIAQPVPVGGHDLVGAAVEGGDGGPEPQVDLVVGVPLGWVDVDGVAGGAAVQVALGQRWPLVGSVGFGPEQHDASGEALGS